MYHPEWYKFSTAGFSKGTVLRGGALRKISSRKIEIERKNFV